MAHEGPQVRLIALREAVTASPILSSYQGLVSALDRCRDDYDLHDGVFGFGHLSTLRERSRRTVDLAREAARRDLPYRLTLAVDITAGSLGQVDVQMEPVYPAVGKAS